MAQPKPKAPEATPRIKPKHSSSQEPHDPIKQLSERQAKDLIIGLCGPIGSGVKTLRQTLESVLHESGYETEHVHISKLMEKFPQASQYKHYEDASGRYRNFQKLGNLLREKYTNTILAEAAISYITNHRELSKAKSTQIENTNDEQSDDNALVKTNHKIAYIIDQLKNPAEVELLRLVYQHNFYLIGTIRSESEKRRNLRDEGIEKTDIDELIHIDRKSGGKTGQQTEKTLLDSDFFIKNTQSHKAELRKKLSRFIRLIHGCNGISPTINEKGMYSAFSSSLQSACLSRQVGAAIADEHGNILATGRNDVPKYGGGLYLFEDEDKDYRCVHKGGKCYNDYHKTKIQRQIKCLLTKELESFVLKGDITTDLSDEVKEKIINEIKNNLAFDLAQKIHKDTPVGSLIEYSRAIHAEMDAITTLARIEGASTFNKTLYSTTYPCHNCARHIVAAGIKNVIYIEPYEKSLALDLHDDAITDLNEENKVQFEIFEGISPRRYQKLFFAPYDRKIDTGEAKLQRSIYQIDIQLLESYREYEDRLFAEFQNKTNINF